MGLAWFLVHVFEATPNFLGLHEWCLSISGCG